MSPRMDREGEIPGPDPHSGGYSRKPVSAEEFERSIRDTDPRQTIGMTPEGEARHMDKLLESAERWSRGYEGGITGGPELLVEIEQAQDYFLRVYGGFSFAERRFVGFGPTEQALDETYGPCWRCVGMGA